MASISQNSYIQAYKQATLALVRSLVVKSKYAIYATNLKIREEHGDLSVDPHDPKSWKYYLNVSGAYHFTDTPMHVISLDTKEQILFSPSTLKFHTATAEAYRNGSRFYHALVRRFPSQEFLINCILTPCDIDQAIAADDGAILAYDKTLVEENENTLIMELENFIKLFNSRFNVEAFALTDPYYAYMQRYVLGLQLPAKVMNLRQARCKTEEVHSFHLREYLASHMGLDKWLEYLTRDQALWLYRNIRYLMRNAGKDETFKNLITNILDKRQIPLAHFTVRQMLAHNEHMYPEILVRRDIISLAKPSVQDTNLTMDELFYKEGGAVFGNPEYLAHEGDKIQHKFKVANTSIIQTKDLESSMVDLTSSVPDPLNEVMMRQWVSMTHMGLYNIIVNFQDPVTSIEYSLGSWDAICYVLYLTAKAEKIPFEKLPLSANNKFRMHPRPHVEELTRLIEPGMGWLYPIAEELVRAQPVLQECKSVSMFYEMTYQVYEECQKHWKLMAGTHDVYTRGVMEQMILKLFGASLRDFSRGEDVERWRVRLNLPNYNLDWDQTQALIREIFEKATGYRVENNRDLRKIQAALLGLFETMSSYSIQLLREINDEELILAGGNGIRVGNIIEEAETSVSFRTGIHSLDNASFVEDYNDFPTNLETGAILVETVQEDRIEISDVVDVVFAPIDNIEELITISRSDIDVKSKSLDPVNPDFIEADGLEAFLSQSTLKKLATSELFK